MRRTPPRSGGPLTTTAPTPSPTDVPPPPPAFGDNGIGRPIKPIAARPSRPPPSQGDITRVINNNKIGIKTCYQRALLRDSSLTHGKIVVGVTIGISGRSCPPNSMILSAGMFKRLAASRIASALGASYRQ